MEEEEKLFKLVYRGEDVLAIGTEEYCELERLKYSLEYNSAFLIISEYVPGENLSVSCEDRLQRGIDRCINIFEAGSKIVSIIFSLFKKGGNHEV